MDGGSVVEAPTQSRVGRAVGTKVSHWRTGTFGPASEEPYRRRTSDWIRLVTAAVLLYLIARHANDLTRTERDVFQFFNGLPGGMKSFFRTLYRFGALWAVGLVVVAALVARRWRLARDLAIAGVLAWAIARALGAFVDSDSLRKSVDIVVKVGHDSPAFPQVRIAIIFAVVCTASPYLTRPTRRIGLLAGIAVAFSAMYLGTGYPSDLLGGVVVGWGVAALVHLAFGSPGGRPTGAQVGAALEEFGIEVESVRLAPEQPPDRTLMLTDDDRGPLVVNVFGRDEADAQFFAKVGRSIMFKDSGMPLSWTRLQQVEHEAYTILLADRAGVAVPEVVVAGIAGPGAALLVMRAPLAPRLADLDADGITDSMLDAVWQQAKQLADASITHGALNAHHIVIGDDGPVIVDFERAASARAGHRAGRDAAELLASTALMVGPERATAAAFRGIGGDGLTAALPFLQPAALSSELRDDDKKRKELEKRLDALRTLGAQTAGTEEPALEPLYRVDKTNLLMAIGTLVAVFALLSQVGSPQELWDTVKDATWYWLVIAFALSLSTNIAFAVALMGTVPTRLPLWPTTECQLAMSFSNLAVPAVGGYATQIRFLQKQGTDLASAVAAGGILSTVANVFSQIVLFGIALWLAPNSIDFGNVDTNEIIKVVALILLVLLAAVGLVLGVGKLRRTILPPVERAMTTIWAALRDPKRICLLLAGNFAASLLYGACLLACLAAFGASISFWTLLAANIGVSTIASLIPIPGGGTAVSAVGLSGLLVAAGVPDSAAVAAILANQLVVSFIPAVPGWFATRDMFKRGYV